MRVVNTNAARTGEKVGRGVGAEGINELSDGRGTGRQIFMHRLTRATTGE